MTPFEPLLSPTSILRRLPDALREEDRLKLEGIALSADIITAAYINMEAIAASHEDFSIAPIGQHANMFRHAWTIVHEAFLFRNMLRLLLPDGGGPKQQKLFELIEPAHKLRRMRDHLSTNVKNAAMRRGRNQPLYGCVSWLRPKEDVGPLPTGTVTVISAGSHFPQKLSRTFGHFGKYHKNRPVDGFIISAFDTLFEISHTLLGMREIISGIEENVEDQANIIPDGVKIEDVELMPIHLYGHTLIFEVDVIPQQDHIYQVEMKLVHPTNVKFRPESPN